MNTTQTMGQTSLMCTGCAVQMTAMEIFRNTFEMNGKVIVQTTDMLAGLCVPLKRNTKLFPV